MRATGVVRRVDELGRIVLPIELRRPDHLGKTRNRLFVLWRDKKFTYIQKQNTLQKMY